MDLWVNTRNGGLVRADWIVRVEYRHDKKLIVTTVCPVGDGGDRWRIDPEEHEVCRAGELHGMSARTQQRPDWYLVELLARLRGQGEAGIIAINKTSGRVGFRRFDLDTELDLD